MHAHFDCFAGISGDMTLGALIDLGVPVDWLTDKLVSLPLSGFKIKADRTFHHGINAQDIQVILSPGQPVRDWAAIRTLIDSSPLKPRVKSLSLAIFNRIAMAEAGIHRTDPEKVHFHELGGVDAIVDIVGTALGVTYLSIDSVTASKIALGSGLVECQHGILPVPVPATLAILKDVPVYGTTIARELTTPTGAAIVAELASRFGDMPAITIKKVGYGAGKRHHKDLPNLLRMVIGETGEGVFEADVESIKTESIVMVEAVIDDMNPEFYGYLMERLFEDGALDVCWLSAQMKKNRPGTLIQVLCQPQQKQVIARRLLGETTTLGVRYYPMRRDTLARETVSIVTPSFGTIQTKRIIGIDGAVRLVPEYEICRKIAIESNQSLRKVYATVQKEIDEENNVGGVNR